MADFGIEVLAQTEVLAGDGVEHFYPVGTVAEPRAVPAFHWAEVGIILNRGVGGNGSVTFRMEVSHDGATWFRTNIHDLTATTAKNIQAATVVVAADTQRVVLALSNPAPYVRLVAANGAGLTDVALWAGMITVD
jgi:hypothetical protein